MLKSLFLYVMFQCPHALKKKGKAGYWFKAYSRSTTTQAVHLPQYNLKQKAVIRNIVHLDSV